VFVTNTAIVDAVIDAAPKTILDVGCGEGWLVRELGKVGINALGVDIVPDFITYAKQQGGGRFHVVSFEELSPDVLKERFDAVVCNFSLLGDESVCHVFRQASSILTPNGSMIVQTLHPITECGEGRYEDGWQEGSWSGFNDSFSDPPPWFFRTRESWEALFTKNGFTLSRILEPLHPKTGMPASIIFIGVSLN